MSNLKIIHFSVDFYYGRIKCCFCGENQTRFKYPIEEWDLLKSKYKELEEEENAAATDIPDWHLQLVEKETRDVESGTSDLMDWQEARKKFKL